MRDDAQTQLLYGIMAILVVVALCALCGFHKWRGENSGELNEPLVDNGDVHRVDVALREAEEVTIACKHCGFENFSKATTCGMCGESVGSDDKKVAVAAAGTTDTVQILTSGGVNAPLSRRLKRARRRREWVRRLDADGKLTWFRDRSNGADLRFPGYAVLFEDVEQLATREALMPQAEPEPERSSKDAESAEVSIVVHATNDAEEEETSAGASESRGVAVAQPLLTLEERMQELLALAKTTRLEVTDSSVADASLLPLVRQSKASVQWSDVLAISTNVFPAKHAHFVASTSAMIVPAEREVIKLNLKRENLFQDSIESLSAIPMKSIHSVMRINFVDEAGVDAGGLQREWFVLLNEKLVDAASGVFTCANKAEQTFFLNPNSRHDIGENHLVAFFAAGRLIGRALLEGSVIGLHLSLPLLKIMLGLPITFSDMEHFDPELYKNLLWIMENDGVESLGLDFSVTEKRGDDVVVVDLIPNGSSIDVTEDNKDEYLERRFRYVLFESVSSQLLAFLKGFYDVIPQDLLMLFDPEEFDYLLCGSDEIDVDDWEKNTKISNNLRGQPALIWFWQIVREMPNEYRQRLLHFATGSSRVPIAGFRSLTSYDGRLCLFTLRGVPLKDDGYIWSHACFNRLDLPLHVVRHDLKAVLYATLDTEMYGFTTD